LSTTSAAVSLLPRPARTPTTSLPGLEEDAGLEWWLRDGKVARFQQMVDTAAVARSLTGAVAR
jgi:hypothetical protein